MLKDLGNIDRRFAYLVLVVVLFVPLYKPMGLPLPITRETRGAYNFVESLPPNSKVLITNATGPSTEAELKPQMVAVVRHLMAKGHKIVICSLAVDTPPYNDAVFAEHAKTYNYTAGKDYLVLPYKAGGETAVASMARDVKSLYTTDAANKPLPGQPLWDDIKDIKSFALVIDIGGGESQRWVLGHIEGPHKVPSIAAITAVILAVTQPYFSSGQFKGLISGLSGAAEYELLAKVPGAAAAGMDAQSLGHAWIILLVILGNIAYLSQKSEKKAGR